MRLEAAVRKVIHCDTPEDLLDCAWQGLARVLSFGSC